MMQLGFQGKSRRESVAKSPEAAEKEEGGGTHDIFLLRRHCQRRFRTYGDLRGSRREGEGGEEGSLQMESDLERKGQK